MGTAASNPAGVGLRVAHLGKFYPPASGGIETHVAVLARAQARLGARVEVLCINHRDQAGRDVTDQRFALTPTLQDEDAGIPVRRVGRWAKLARVDLCPALRRELVALRRRGVDILHVHTPNPLMLLALASLPPFSTLVVTHHSDVIRQRALGAALRPLELLTYSRAALVLATSERYIEGSPLLRRFSSKVRPLPLGIELEPFLSPGAAALAQRRRWEDELGTPLWLSVGRLVYYKGLETALAALREVPGRLLVGGVGPAEAELRRRARELGVAGRVTFAGYLEPDALVGAYLAATALWFPSNARSEGYGLSQVEAMASGCPVINTDLAGSGVPWVSPHERTGLTVPVGDARALAAAARRLLEEPGLRDRLTRQAAARARAELGAEVMGRRSMALYRRALGLADEVLPLDGGQALPREAGPLRQEA